jgi:signal transduction histidine kinase
VRQKWRPPLALVVGGTLAAVLALPMAGIWALLRLGRAVGDGTAVLAVVLAIVVATLVLGYLLWRLIWGPVTALADRARAVAEGRAGAAEPLDHYGTDELGRLGQRMLDMEAALRSREATVRAFADHVTHELKTPLTAIRGAAELLESGELAEGDRRLAATIRDAAARMEAELAALRRVALAREPRHHGHCRLAELLPALAEAFPGLSIDVTGGEVRLPLAAEGVRVVLTQLLGNAAAHGATRVEIRAAPGALTVADNGPGISEGNRSRVFEPFFTTRREAGGTGMGLPIARALLEAHGASIGLDPGAGGGAAFRIAF